MTNEEIQSNITYLLDQNVSFEKKTEWFLGQQAKFEVRQAMMHEDMRKIIVQQEATEKNLAKLADKVDRLSDAMKDLIGIVMSHENKLNP